MEQQNQCSEINPKIGGSHTYQEAAAPCMMIIFGITGDLAKRLLIPALCNLGYNGLLNEDFYIVGIGRKPFTTESLREEIQKNINEFVPDPEVAKFGSTLSDRVSYVRGDVSEKELFQNLKNELDKISLQKNTKNTIFYLAVPPDVMTKIVISLNELNLLTEEKDFYKRIIIEKPFGRDVPSAKELNQKLLNVINEDQIYRIDHFLGKETVQNLLTFRFLNNIFESIWNHHYVDNIQITVAEKIGVGTRGTFYEETGALRDMVPNHMFQILSLLAMEAPLSLSSGPIRDEKTKLLKSIQIMDANQVTQRAVRGQYGPGTIDSTKVPGYRSEQNVSPHSTIETYVAMKLLIDNLRWINVPFYLRTGKCLHERTTKIVIKFKSPPAALFGKQIHNVCPNLLCINIQPQEGIILRIGAKVPGMKLQVNQVNMSFKYCEYFGMKTQTGYEVLLYDCMNGDNTSFTTADMIETSWAIVQPILDVWDNVPATDFPNYAAGTWGPTTADELLQRDNRQWFS